MNKQLKAKWMKALRSGEYTRGSGALVNASGTKFCCLGVLADIQGCEWKQQLFDDGLIPVSKSGRAIVQTTTDFLPVSRAGGLSWSGQKTLANMNDDGKSFREIADYIEQNL